jgi:beta-glucosidase-like glycosyl hydrolase/CubicO group peptidase (beta-lactamase class C family)
MIRLFFIFIITCSTYFSTAQKKNDAAAQHWVDSIFRTLSPDEKIAQLMVVRMSSPGNGNGAIFYDSLVEALVRKYNIGGICLFQGGPLQQAQRINFFQSISKTPILFCVDAEWGLGMRFDSVRSLYRQMMLGAVQDASIPYQYGRLVGEQCKRMGIQVNYAPVVDVNNNPNNPVINDRSFGENKYKVAEYGIAYMKGMKELDVMGCAKHFPGHGDVSVDSHLDLPVINKSKTELDSLELYPFREMFKAGVGSVMIAHLYIPAIDKTANRATSLSYNNVTKLLKKDLHYNGLTFTDALEMKGVAKYFPDGEASVQSLIAGNDMLCLPGDVPGSIEKIREAIKKKKLKWKDIDTHVKKVLYAKYYAGLHHLNSIITYNLTEDLNSKVDGMNRIIAENAITLLKNDQPDIFPLIYRKQRVAYIGFGLKEDNLFAQRIRDDYKAHVYYFDYSLDSTKAAANLELLKDRYDVVVIGMHNYNRRPAKNFGLSNASMWLLKQVQQQFKTITLAFGNPYAMKDICDSKVLIACYEDDSTVHSVAADLLNGRFAAKGKLPVTVCDELKYGTGIVASKAMPEADPSSLGFKTEKFRYIDSVINDGIKKEAFPGAVLLVAKGGKIAYEKAYGYLTYEKKQPVYTSTIYDMASVTKILATTLCVMKLYDEGKLSLDKTLADYLTWVKGSDKANLIIKDVLLHQAGLKSFIPFYKEVCDSLHGNIPGRNFFSYKKQNGFDIHVANNMYMRNDWIDTMYKRILQSELTPKGKYIYSDNDFIFLGKIVESISGKPLDQYVKENFYDKLGLQYSGFKPLERFPLNYIAPTENEKGFRSQLLWGYVHDPGAAMFGGVAGHAGLFSNAEDLAVLSQMLLNGGSFNNQTLLKKETIDLFTSYQSEASRRGYGFDKPEKDNATRKEPYPCLSASPKTFGHTGFTGTCVWIDPQYELIYIFLSNRVNPWGGENNKLSKMNIRTKIQEALYEALR